MTPTNLKEKVMDIIKVGDEKIKAERGGRDYIKKIDVAMGNIEAKLSFYNCNPAKKKEIEELHEDYVALGVMRYRVQENVKKNSIIVGAIDYALKSMN